MAKKKKKKLVKKLSSGKNRKPQKNKKVLPRKQAKKAGKILKSKRIKRIKKAAIVKVKKAKKANGKVTLENNNFFKPRIKVIGIGGGGGSIVSDMGKSLSKATFMVADTDLRSLKKKGKIKYFVFGQEFTHGLGTGSNVELSKQAAESVKERIEEVVKDQDIVVLVASLGGGVGSGAAQVFAKIAKNYNVMTLGIFLLPFKFEGQDKQKIARESLKHLKNQLNVSLVIPNERIFKVIAEDTMITEAFSMVNKNLIQSLESLIDLIHNPGLINIDFADLKTVLGGKGNGAFLNTVEESGKDRAEKVAKNILLNPLIQNTGFAYERILLNIAGSKNLSMLEVSKISMAVSNLAPAAKIIFGISKENSLHNKIKTTLLTTGLYADLPIAKAEAKEKKKIIEKVIKKPIKKPSKNKGLKKKSEEDKKIKISSESYLIPLNPVFNTNKVSAESANINFLKIDRKPLKSAIRRSALDIKKEQEKEEKRKQLQEEEWEIPAFLRLKK